MGDGAKLGGDSLWWRRFIDFNVHPDPNPDAYKHPICHPNAVWNAFSDAYTVRNTVCDANPNAISGTYAECSRMSVWRLQVWSC